MVSGSSTSVPPPPCARLGNLKIPAGGRATPLDLDAGGTHIKLLACFMFRQHASDVIIDNDHFVHMWLPLFGEHPNCGGSTANAPSVFTHIVDDRRVARLHDDLRAVINLQRHRFAIA